MTDCIAVLFDVQNLYHSSKIYGGSKVSYKDLLGSIVEGRELSFACAYTAHKNDKDVGMFHKALKASNIDVVSKRIQVKKDDSNGKGSRLVPAHFDVEIATDALMARYDDPKVTTVVLCTGNGNFAYLVDALLVQGVKVEVWSFEESTSKDLKEKAKFVQIPKDCLLSAHKETTEAV